MAKHLYRHGGAKANLPAFERRYGKRGKYVEGAVIGKIKREREAEKAQIRRELANPKVHPSTKSQLREKLRMLES